MASTKEALPGLRRGILVLESLATQPSGMTFGEISALMPESPPSTVSRLIKVLLEEQLIEKPESSRNYVAAGRAFDFARTLLGSIPRSEILRPVINRLAEETGQSAAYFEFTGSAMILLAKREPDQAFHYMDEGRALNHTTTHGFCKLIAAFQSESVRNDLIANSARPTRQTMEELENEYRNSFAEKEILSRVDDHDWFCRAAAAVFEGDTFAGAIGVTIIPNPLPDCEMEKIMNSVRYAARQASEIITAHA